MFPDGWLCHKINLVAPFCFDRFKNGIVNLISATDEDIPPKVKSSISMIFPLSSKEAAPNFSWYGFLKNWDASAKSIALFMVLPINGFKSGYLEPSSSLNITELILSPMLSLLNSS